MWLLLLWHSRLLLRIALTLALVLLLIAGVWQFWVVPRLEQYRPQLVAELSRMTGVHVEVGALSGGWDGLRPELTLQNVRTRDDSGHEVLRFERLEGALSWWALPLGRLEFSRIELTAPQLHAVRQQDGNWRVAGVVLTPAQGSDSSFLNWLLKQDALVVSRGSLMLEDEAQPGQVLKFTELDLNARRFLGWRHVSFGFTPMVDIGQRISGSGVLRGNDINHLGDWSGKVNFRLPSVDLARLNASSARFLPALFARLPVVRAGTGRLSLALAFDGQSIDRVDADLGLEKLHVEQAGQTFQLPFFDASAHWESGKNREKLVIDARRIDAAGGPLARNGRFEYTLAKGERGLLLRDFNLDEFSAYVPLLPGEWSGTLAGAKLAGNVAKLRYAWKGDWQKPVSWQGEADLRGLDMGLPRWLPHMGKLDVVASFDEKKGTARLASKAFKLDYPEQFTEPLILDKLDAVFEWKRVAAGWEISTRGLELSNKEAAVSLGATYRWTGKDLGYVDLKGEISRMPANRVYAYLPRAVGDDTLVWLKDSLRAGRAGNGKAEWRGEVARFPYADGSGRFRITADARDVTLSYANGWPAITSIDGQLIFDGPGMTIHAPRARIFDVELKDIETRIPDLSEHQHVLVDGKAQGATSGFLRFVQQSPVKESTQGFLDTLKAEGKGQLELKLDIPLDDTDLSKVSGNYRFAGNRLDFGGSIPVLHQAAGRVDFTESALKIHEASGRALGGTVRLSGASEKGAVKLALSGDALLAEVARRYGLPQSKRYNGGLGYQGELIAQRDRYELALQSSLAGARIDLPQPLGKSANEARPLRVKASGDNARQTIEFGYGRLLSGALALQNGGSWAGAIALGATSPSLSSISSGVGISGGWAEIDLNAWMGLLDGGNGQSLPVNSVDLTFDRVTGWGKRLEFVQAKAALTAQGWSVQLASRQAAGNLSWRSGPKPLLTGRLDRLQLPLPVANGVAGAAGASAATSARANADPKPALDLTVNDFRYKSADLGQLAVKAQPQGDGWQLNAITLTNPDGRFDMSGLWQGSGASERTTAKLSLKSENAGKLLERLGYPDTLRRASTILTGEGGWQGSPFSPEQNTVHGKLRLDVEAGQFAKIEPGAGRLISVISLQSLSRRVKLDFRDVFSDGLEFDSIKGDVVIDKGVARTDNLTIESPSARVRFKGDANIPAGTQNLRVRIVPLVGDAASLAVGVVNPIAGAATFVLQRLMKDPFGQLISYEYDITGEWENPKVGKVK